MEQTKFWPRPFDEDNLTTDWIEETFGEKGWMRAPWSEESLCYTYFGFLRGVLVKVMWEFGKNQLSVIACHDVDGSKEYLQERANEAISEAIVRMEKFEKDENMYADGENLSAVRYMVSNNRVDFFFFWECVD